MKQPFEDLTYRERLLVNDLLVRRQTNEDKMLVVEDLRRENEALKAFLDKEMERLERPRAVWEPWYSWMRVKVNW